MCSSAIILLSFHHYFLINKLNSARFFPWNFCIIQSYTHEKFDPRNEMKIDFKSLEILFIQRIWLRCKFNDSRNSSSVQLNSEDDANGFILNSIEFINLIIFWLKINLKRIKIHECFAVAIDFHCSQDPLTALYARNIEIIMAHFCANVSGFRTSSAHSCNFSFLGLRSKHPHMRRMYGKFIPEFY